MKRQRGERGFALISAIVLAFLFFALMGLLLIESTMSLRLAHDYRAKVLAHNLAESGLQLALQDLQLGGNGTVEFKMEEGTIVTVCTLRPNVLQGGEDFEVIATGSSAGVSPTTARVVAVGTRTVGDVVLRRVEHHDQ